MRKAPALIGAALILGCLSGAAPVDHGKASLQESLRKADIDFNAAVARSGLEAWVGAFAADGRQLGPGRMPIGQEAIRANMRPFFESGRRSLTWKPVEVQVSDDGTLGYTIGEFRSMVRDSTGAGQIAGTGRYVTIWRRQAGGDWKVVVDLGATDPEPDGLKAR